MPNNELARESMLQALRIRRDHNIDRKQPLNPIDLAEQMDIEVRFCNIPTLEGLYIKENPPHILLPSDRPMGRQMHACAHEIGHHVFGHGTQTDACIQNNILDRTPIIPEELAANIFAANLIMPRAVVLAAFNNRGWSSAEHPRPEEAYTVACSLGISYTGLLSHMAHGINILQQSTSNELGKIPLPNIRAEILGHPCSERLIPIDLHWSNIAVDLWVGDHIYVAPNASIENEDLIIPEEITTSGRVFTAHKPGITRLALDDRDIYIRVCRAKYEGLASHRFWEDPDAN